MNNRGFTLLEVLIAIAVLVIGLAGVLALVPVGMETGRRAVERQHAADLLSSLDAGLELAFRQVKKDDQCYVDFRHEETPIRLDLPAKGEADAVYPPEGEEPAAYPCLMNPTDLELCFDDRALDPAADFSFRLLLSHETGDLADGGGALYRVTIMIYRHFRRVDDRPLLSGTSLKAAAGGGA